jgi:hypothetical protein
VGRVLQDGFFSQWAHRSQLKWCWFKNHVHYSNASQVEEQNLNWGVAAGYKLALNAIQNWLQNWNQADLAGD